MNILMTGKGGNAGSWKMRGEQLGGALGARVVANAPRHEVERADVAVVVKRVSAELLDSFRRTDTPWVYDLVDCYPQPTASKWTRDQAIAWVQNKLENLQPAGVIWPNQRMRQDCDTGLPGLVLKHHHRVGIKNNPIREQVTKVGYEGDARYLSSWEEALRKECSRRGWEFVINPDHLAELDIVLAVRGGEWEGYAPIYWKSGVKLSNAHGSGTPFVGTQECGYIEQATGAEYWAHDPGGLGVCFDWLEDQGARELIHDRFVQSAYPVEMAAADLKEWLCAARF